MAYLTIGCRVLEPYLALIQVVRLPVLCKGRIYCRPIFLVLDFNSNPCSFQCYMNYFVVFSDATILEESNDVYKDSEGLLQ